MAREKCPDHNSNVATYRVAQRNREPLDHIMQKLPTNQGGHGGQRCAYCAYLEGRKDMKNEILKKISDEMNI